MYVSTSNFRPTLPNFGQDSQTEETTAPAEAPNNKKPKNLIQQIPLVLAPKQPVTTSTASTTTTAAPTTTSTETSSTSENIHNILDELQSNLQFHLQDHREESTTTTSTTTAAPTTEATTKFSLFTFKTEKTTSTTTTTTAKPKSLQELLERSHGLTTTTAAATSAATEQTRKSFGFSLREKLKALKREKLKEAAEEKETLEEGKKIPETNRISSSYSDRFKLNEIPIKNDDVSKFLPKDYPTTSAASDEKNSNALLRELFKTINLKESIENIRRESTTDSSFSTTRKPSTRPTENRDFKRFRPTKPDGSINFSAGFRKPSETKVQLDDVSKFLPKDYKTTSEKPKLDINSLFENVEIDSSLLPKDYKPKSKVESAPLDLLPKDYPNSSEVKIKTEEIDPSLLPKDYLPKITTEEIDPSLLPPGYPQTKIKTEDAPLSLLPPGYDPSKVKEEEPAFSFTDIDPSLLPPGYDPSQVPEEPEEEDKSQSGNDSKKPLIKLNFWPGAKKSEASTRKPARFNNQPEIPKITPFVRYVPGLIKISYLNTTNLS